MEKYHKTHIFNSKEEYKSWRRFRLTTAFVVINMCYTIAGPVKPYDRRIMYQLGSLFDVGYKIGYRRALRNFEKTIK